MKITALLNRLWGHVTERRRKQLAVLMILMVLASFSEVVSIGAVLPFLGVLMAPDQAFNHALAQPFIKIFRFTETHQLLLLLTVFFVSAALFSGAMRLVMLWFQTRLGFAIGADLSSEIYKKTLYQPYSVHVSRNSSQVTSGILTKTNAVIYSTLMPVLFVSSSLFILVSILVALIAIDPAVALVTFGGFGILYGAIIFASKKRLARDSWLISAESNQVMKALQEGLGGIRDVLIDGTQKTYCKIYSEADLPLRKAQANVQIIAAAPRFLIESLGMALIAVLAYSLVGAEDGVESAIPVLGALAIGAQRLLPVLQLMYASVSNIRGSQTSLEDVLALLDQPLPEYAVAPVTLPMHFNALISINNVSFRYSNITPWVLQDVSLRIQKGSRIGFIGSTGSGKSTLLDLVMGLLQPTSGHLVIDDVQLTPANTRAWQAHIAHVPQSIFLADASIAENIAFGIAQDKIDYDKVKIVATQAQISDAIESWDKKYETNVGERGVCLSGGQRQRIGIARALYREANVIVLDEATSALDNATERAVMETIRCIARNITVLTIAHRLTTLKDCDLIFELEQGCIKRSGSYEEMVLHDVTKSNI